MTNSALDPQCGNQDRISLSGGKAAFAQAIVRGGRFNPAGWLAINAGAGTKIARAVIKTGAETESVVGISTAAPAMAAQISLHDFAGLWSQSFCIADPAA